MPRKRKPTWTAATEFKVIKLKPNGPKQGQPVDAWLHGKTKGYEELVDNPKTKFTDLP